MQTTIIELFDGYFISQLNNLPIINVCGNQLKLGFIVFPDVYVSFQFECIKGQLSVRLRLLEDFPFLYTAGIFC